MSRSNQMFKATVNVALSHVARMVPGADLGSEATLARDWQASRTTVRNVLTHLAGAGVILWEGRCKRLLRVPVASDYFPQTDVESTEDQAEQRFLEWMMRCELPPGSVLHESDLSRQLSLSVGVVRALLQRFQPMGLFEKNPNKHWVLHGFTRRFAAEMFAMRRLIETDAISAVLGAAQGSVVMQEMAHMERLHIALLARDDPAMAEFPALDSQFHRCICRAADNRFFDEFSQRISVIVHYHYQWNKRDEVARNRAALHEHLAVIRAVLEGRKEDARQAFAAHLDTARATLMASVSW
ncbi:GntR family transcriptional regulator [Rhodobacteraceae bacterium]|nr:GntR family transcriptional regulator [Paracoccaceae bacterium]